MATDNYGQGITVPALIGTPNIGTIGTAMSDIVGQGVLRFDSAAERTATLTGASAPVEGMVSWLRDTNLLYVHNGTSWVSLSTQLMGWTDLASLGTYGGGVTPGLPAPRMRKVSDLGTEVWEIEGRITVVALSPAFTTLMFTFDADHRVATGRGFATYNSSHYGTRVTIAPDGKLSVSVPTEAGSSVTNIWLDGIRITNPAA